MKPLLLPWCSSISGHFTSRLSVNEPERLHPFPRCSKPLHCGKHHINHLLHLQECNIIYNSISFLDGNQQRLLLSRHSSVPFSGCSARDEKNNCLFVQSRVNKIESSLATSASVYPVYHLKKKHKNAGLGIKHLELPCHHFEGSSHLSNFSIEFRGYQRKRSARDLCSSRVHAESENSNRSWWQQFLFDPIDIEDFPEYSSDVEDDEEWETDGSSEGSENIPDGASGQGWVKDDIDRMLADDASFAAWQQRNKARTELRESQALGRSPDNDNWEDWLEDSWGDYSSYAGGKDSGWYSPPSDWEKGGLPRTPPDLPERGMSRTMKELLFRIFEDEEEVKDDLAFEDRVFRFTSQNTVKFVAVLITVPWLVAYVSHDFLIVPFLNRYVETVPLAAELLDLRESQKLNMVETLKMERQRVRFEAALGKAPPLSDEELLEHIREEALELRDELRLENRKAFGNIWSDLLAGLTIFLLLVFNPEKVAIMRLTGNRLFTNISDTGKAFLIILLSDIFLGYHSESGWETVVEMFLDRYGFQVDQASIYIFVAIVPVTIDACFKLWVFRNLTRLSPSAAATFKEMKRH